MNLFMLFGTNNEQLHGSNKKKESDTFDFEEVKTGNTIFKYNIAKVMEELEEINEEDELQIT